MKEIAGGILVAVLMMLIVEWLSRPRPKKKGCPIEFHADDCDCNGEWGDR